MLWRCKDLHVVCFISSSLACSVYQVIVRFLQVVWSVVNSFWWSRLVSFLQVVFGCFMSFSRVCGGGKWTLLGSVV